LNDASQKVGRFSFKEPLEMAAAGWGAVASPAIFEKYQECGK